MTKNVLEEYLFQIIRNEQRKYELQKIKEVAYSKKKALESEKFLAYETQAEEIKPYIHMKIIDLFQVIGMLIAGIVVIWFGFGFFGGLLGEFMDFFIHWSDNEIDNMMVWINRIRNCIFILWILLSVGCAKESDWFISRISRREAKQKNLSAKQEVERRNTRIQEYNDVLKRRKEQIIPIYNKEYKCLGEEYIQIEKNLEQLYGLNIIFPKYRNMMAICSLYEYISSGRCDTLEGQAGAYNLYEMELRQNVIIGQLEKVISQLESIKNNQYIFQY